MHTKLLSPSKKARQKLKGRVDVIKSQLPANWKILYFYEFPEDKGQDVFLTNVIAGKSLHEATIVKLEKLCEKLKEKQLLQEKKSK
jgi:hypothetical protein